MPDFIDAIDQRIKQKVTDTFSEGVIVSVLPRFVRVKLTGSSRTVTAYYDSGMALEKGKRVFITWSKQQGRYVVLSSFDAMGSNAATANRNPADFQLSPPSDIAVKAFPKALGLVWNDPIAQVLAYEVQSNSSATDVGATTELVTRGIFLKPATATTYFRVRSITTDFRYSSWSDWVNGTPEAITITTTYAALTDVDLTGLADGDSPIWDAGTNKWVPGAGSGGFTGDAFDVPYTPTDSGDWAVVPADVGEALDVLAATGGGGGSSLTVREVDGTPSVALVDEIQVPNGLLEDLGGGAVRLSRSRRDLYGEPDGSLMSLSPNYWAEFDGSSLPGDWSVTGGSVTVGPTADAGRSCVEIEMNTTGGSYVHTLTSPISGDLDFETRVWMDTFSTTASSNGMEITLCDSSNNIIMSVYFYHISSQYYYQAYATFTGTSYASGSMQLPLIMSRAVPYHFKITRVSGLASAYHSWDGENWNFMASKSSVTTTVDKIAFRPYKQAGSINTKSRFFYARINS